MVTIDGEIAFMWQRKVTPVGVLFAANRYGAVAYGILAIASGYASAEHVSRFSTCGYDLPIHVAPTPYTEVCLQLLYGSLN